MEAKIVSVTHLRPKLLENIAEVARVGQEYIITKKGKPAAVLVSYDEWESMKATMELLSDPIGLKRIKKSHQYYKRGGKGKSIKEVFGE